MREELGIFLDTNAVKEYGNRGCSERQVSNEKQMDLAGICLEAIGMDGSFSLQSTSKKYVQLI